MEYASHRYAVVREATPESALYFENAYGLFGGVNGVLTGVADLFQIQEPNRIPEFLLDTEKELNIKFSAINSSISNSAIKILENNFVQDEKTRSFYPRIKSFVSNYGGEQYGNRETIVSEFVQEFGVDTDNPFDARAFVDNLMIAATTAYLRSQGKYTVPIFENISFPNWIRGNSLADGVELALVDLPLVDCQTCSWDHVKEIRNDEDSARQLRNLRLFLEGIDKNMGKAHLQDMLLGRVDEYSTAAKKHGFTTKKQTINALIGMEHLPKLIACGVFALIDPGLNSIDALAGLFAATEIKGAFKELGGLGISLKEAELTKGMENKHQEVEYLMSIKNKLTT
jgi:hypothetical protein